MRVNIDSKELGIAQTTISKWLKAFEDRKKLKKIFGSNISEISTSTLIEISGLEEKDQEKII